MHLSARHRSEDQFLLTAGRTCRKMGVADLQYLGNTMVPEWKGCPDEAMKRLGVTPPVKG